MDTHDLRRGFHFEIRNRNFTSISCDGHTRSPQRVPLRNQKSQLYQPSMSRDGPHDLRRELHFEQRIALGNQKSQFYQHFMWWARTISAEGCNSKSEIATLPAFRAMETHDRGRGLHFSTKKRNFTSIPCTRHARSPQTVHISKPSEALRLPRNHEPRSYEMLHWPRKSILKLKFQKRNPSQELSPLTSKYRIHAADSLRLPRKTQSFERRTPANVLATSTKYSVCHNFHYVPHSLHLPRQLTFLTSTCDGFLAPATKWNSCPKTYGNTR